MKLNNDYQSPTFGMAMLKPTKKAINGYVERRIKEAKISVEEALKEISEAENIINKKDEEFIEKGKQLLEEKGIKEKELPRELKKIIDSYQLWEKGTFPVIEFPIPDGYVSSSSHGSVTGSIVDFVNETAPQMYKTKEQELADYIVNLAEKKKKTNVHRLKTRVSNFFNKLKLIRNYIPRLRKTGTQPAGIEKGEEYKNAIGLSVKDYLSSEQLALLSKDSYPYDFLSKEEQAIWNRANDGNMAFEELTQEEKNVFYKFDAILGKIMGLETSSNEREQDIIRNFVTRK